MEKLLKNLITDEQPGAFDGIWRSQGPRMPVISPIDGSKLCDVITADADDCERVMQTSFQAFKVWRNTPVPVRAEVVRQIGEAFREKKEEIAEIITIEMGKALRESQGEVQEMIDVCDFAMGLGRRIGGRTMPSERHGHRIQEQWHSLGAIGVITAFNFPVAVWGWNAAIALVCGDSVLWKPSSKAPLSAIVCTRITSEIFKRNGFPPSVVTLVIGRGFEIGDKIISDSRISLVSYTGSVETGRRVGRIVQERFGRPLLELGGNSAVIVTEKADLNLALTSVLFGAIGTSGQRCTSTRRVIVQESIYSAFVTGLKNAYRRVAIGDPRDANILMGPLVDKKAVAVMREALEKVRVEGGQVLYGGEALDFPGGCYVSPCLAEAHPDMAIVQEETFAPILYILKYRNIEEAIAIQNNVRQGLSSAIFTNSLLESELFLGVEGSDCGMANVNAGTSGAEIGGAFGGEKETGGGRESGSDSWKAYMRRQTSVINSSGKVILAQGIQFDFGA